MKHLATRMEDIGRVHFAADALLAACTGGVCFEADPLLAGELALTRGVVGVATVYSEAAEDPATH